MGIHQEIQYILREKRRARWFKCWLRILVSYLTTPGLFLLQPTKDVGLYTFLFYSLHPPAQQAARILCHGWKHLDMSSTVVSHVNGQNGNISSPEIANGRDTGNKDEIDIFNASSVADIKATLSQLQNREALVTARLDALVASQKDLSRELGRLDLLRAHLGTQASNARYH